MDDFLICILVGIVIAAIIAGFICKFFYDEMKTAREKSEANDYVRMNELVLQHSRDTFISRHVDKTPINQDRGNRPPGPPR
jgi:GDP-D-mannose dehydratase